MVGKYTIAKLPLAHEIETKEVLKKTLEASRALAELKILAKSIPNENILINTLSLQEAKYSSEIENIITTSDDLYKSNFDDAFFISKASKEVHNYAQALKIGKQELLKSNLLTNKLIKQIQQQIEGNNAGFRTQIGTTLKDQDGKIIYTPPQDIVEIETLMTNLEMFINQDEISDLDPLIKMAIIHHQFESIHPFFDGNGRTGRIINILYLIK
ncbi:MAG: addiction module protein, partial [Campylobacteraceae bacterium 4484_166]